MQATDNQVKFLCVSDLHLSDKAPLARTDAANWFQTQQDALIWLAGLAAFTEAPVLCAGDVFDEPYRNRSRPSHALWNMCHRYLPAEFVCVPGQHDLPGQTMANFPDTGLAALWLCDRIRMPFSCFPQAFHGVDLMLLPWGQEWDKALVERTRPCIGLAHRMVWQSSPYPGAPATGNVKAIAQDCKEAGIKVLVSGDNHTPFVYHARNGVTIINPGSFFQTKADQQDHRPGAYEILVNKYSGNVDEIETHYVPGAGPDIISRAHIDIITRREASLQEFVSGLESGLVEGLSFLDNVLHSLRQENVPDGVKQRVLECLGEKDERM